MKTLMRKVVLGAVLAVPTAALAAPCHNVLGAWTFTLACVGRPSPPHFDAQTLHGVVTDQEGCVFLGTLNGFRWVGALAGDGNRRSTRTSATPRPSASCRGGATASSPR